MARLREKHLLAATLGGAMVGLVIGFGVAWLVLQDGRGAGRPAGTAEELRSLLVRGAAHTGIEEWTEALELFERAAKLDPGEPAVAFDLALTRYRLGELETTRYDLARIGAGAPVAIRARAAYLAGKLALEAGDLPGEAEAYRRAAELDPADPAYPYSLARVLPRLDPLDASLEQVDRTSLEVGRLLSAAREAWPGNSRLDAEYAQWALARPEPELRLEGLEVLESLAGDDPALSSQLTLGRGDLEAALLAPPAAPAPVPIPLRRALNLLRPTKRFQTDSARFEDRLQLAALAEPAGDGTHPRRAMTSPSVTLTPADLVPRAAFSDDELILDVVPFNDAVDPVPTGPREAHLALLTHRALWFLAADGEEMERLAEISGGTWLAAGELDGDGLMELVVLGSDGLRIWSRKAGAAWAESTLDPSLTVDPLFAGSRIGALLVDFEHDGDLDLLALTGQHQPVLVIHRGESGWGPPAPAPLKTAGEPVHGFAATDLDGDDDRDLILVGEGELLLLRNWRQGEFTPYASLPVPGRVDDLRAADWDNDGDFDLLALVGGELLFWRNLGGGELERDAVAAGGAAELSAVLVADALSPVDLDLDGDLDLLVAGRSRSNGGRALVVLENAGWGRFLLEPGLTAGAEMGPRGLAALDLDGDRDPDILSWDETGLGAARADGAESQAWLRLGLRGLKGKVPLDGRGARVMVADGSKRQTIETLRPEMTIGLGARSPVLVQVTWPNGISEYLFTPVAGERHPVEQVLRIEGSCPFLYASDESGELRFVTDILGLAPLGMLGGIDRYVPPDPEEYLRLPDWVAARDGVLELRVTEELREVAYLDQLELVAVDAPDRVEVYNGERWIERPVSGLDLKLLGPLASPVSVRDDHGREVLGIVAREDRRYLTNHDTGRLYQGAVELHSLEIELPAQEAARERPALVMVGWLHWGNTSANVARDQDPTGAPVFPYLEVPDGSGGWRTTAIEVGLPAGKTKPVVVDLTGVVDPADPRVRISTDFEVYWDRIAVGNLLADDETPHRVHRLASHDASLDWGGFSRWYRPANNGPYLFDYADRRPWPWRERPDGGERLLSWQEHEGFYTEFGEVTDLVALPDDRLVVLGAGEELILRYATSDLPPPPAGWHRTWFLHNEGWEKDGDPNVACSQTVSPLPSRAMTEYPCPRAPDASNTGFSHTRSPGTDRRTRWVSRDRLERRLEALAAVAERPTG